MIRLERLGLSIWLSTQQSPCPTRSHFDGFSPMMFFFFFFFAVRARFFLYLASSWMEDLVPLSLDPGLVIHVDSPPPLSSPTGLCNLPSLFFPSLPSPAAYFALESSSEQILPWVPLACRGPAGFFFSSPFHQQSFPCSQDVPPPQPLKNDNAFLVDTFSPSSYLRRRILQPFPPERLCVPIDLAPCFTMVEICESSPS